MGRKLLSVIAASVLLLGGCAKKAPAQIVATTAPVYNFTTALCADTPLRVNQLVTESVSCLHDYTLKVEQVKAVEKAETVILSGAGLEEFMEDVLGGKAAIDASSGIALLCGEEEHEEKHHHEDGHHHEENPHIWLSPENAARMAANICAGLCTKYPEYESVFKRNCASLLSELAALKDYASSELSALSTRELITFHDGFSYMAEAFDLEILAAVEEESGSEASAKDLIALIGTVRAHSLPAVFTEVNGSPSAASVISRETGCAVFPLDMAMSGDYFEAMYANIRTIKEALG